METPAVQVKEASQVIQDIRNVDMNKKIKKIKEKSINHSFFH
jgi:hypothetical protein